MITAPVAPAVLLLAVATLAGAQPPVGVVADPCALLAPVPAEVQAFSALNAWLKGYAESERLAFVDYGGPWTDEAMHNVRCFTAQPLIPPQTIRPGSSGIP